jgi:hypothetical protein
MQVTQRDERTGDVTLVHDDLRFPDGEPHTNDRHTLHEYWNWRVEYLKSILRRMQPSKKRQALEVECDSAIARRNRYKA